MLRFFNPYNLRMLLLAVFFFIYISAYPAPQELYRFEIAEGSEVMFYVAEKPLHAEGAEITAVYPFFEVSVPFKSAPAIRQKLGQSAYQTVRYRGDAQKALEALSVREIRYTEICGGKMYRGVSPKLRSSGKVLNCNIMVYTKGGITTVGSPVIYGSY